MNLEDEFCDIMKKARFGQGLGIETLAELAKVEQADVERLEKGHRLPTKGEIQGISQALHLRVGPLVSLTLEGWLPQPQPVWTTEHGLVQTIKGDIGGYEVKGYLLTDPATKQVLMIDTGYNAKQMLATIAQRELTLIGLCLTHGHADHAGGLEEILAQWPVPVYLGNGDFDLLPWKPSDASVKIPADHQMIALGELTIECLATPGHTPGGFCYLLSFKGHTLCFVGDTLFAGSVGRSNPFSLYPLHLQSVHQTVLRLPKETILFPGHGPSTTVAEEQAHNPFG
ncbi:MAG TPA: MBL fold metallo-hydrolase [Nitrospirales bacterium]|nr:MBL fold metallo-hydrolase [Nitrospirales bacterium]